MAQIQTLTAGARQYCRIILKPILVLSLIMSGVGLSPDGASAGAGNEVAILPASADLLNSRLQAVMSLKPDISIGDGEIVPISWQDLTGGEQVALQESLAHLGEEPVETVGFRDETGAATLVHRFAMARDTILATSTIDTDPSDGSAVWSNSIVLTSDQVRDHIGDAALSTPDDCTAWSLGSGILGLVLALIPGVNTAVAVVVAVGGLVITLACAPDDTVGGHQSGITFYSTGCTLTYCDFTADTIKSVEYRLTRQDVIILWAEGTDGGTGRVIYTNNSMYLNAARTAGALRIQELLLRRNDPITPGCARRVFVTAAFHWSKYQDLGLPDTAPAEEDVLIPLYLMKNDNNGCPT